MDGTGMSCYGCGSANVIYDPKTRHISCNQCGREETFRRAYLNKNSRVVYSNENAKKTFLEGKYDSSKHFALEVLDICTDNAPAMYIISYCEEFNEGKAGAMDRFFDTMNARCREELFEYDECDDIRQLIIASAYRMMDYEEKLLELMMLNMPNEEDEKDLAAFVDELCPYLIGKRASANFLTPNLISLYKKIAWACDIPKTCFALLKGIDINPDSPYPNNTFFLEGKVEYFYTNYVKQVGGIIGNMKSSDFSAKFQSAYAQKQIKYEQDMKKQ